MTLTPLELLKMYEDEKNVKVVVPVIQRNFTWEENQIERLFDSIFKKYTIGYFVIWKPRQAPKNMEYYKLTRFYNPKDPFSEKVKDPKTDDLWIVLDGQQRLSSFLIGFNGLYGKALPGRPTKEGINMSLEALCLKLFEKKGDDVEISGEFSFRRIPCKKGGESKENYDLKCPIKSDNWSKAFRKHFSEFENKIKSLLDSDLKDLDKGTKDYLKKIMYSKKDKDKVEEYWIPLKLMYEWVKRSDRKVSSSYVREKLKNVIDFYKDLKVLSEEDYDKIKDDIVDKIKDFLDSLEDEGPLKNILEIEISDVSDVLEIFVRINSGGTQLSRADLISSAISSDWPEFKEKLHSLTQITGINEVDFYVRSMLTIFKEKGSVTPDAKIFLEKDGREIIERIKHSWNNFESSVEKTFDEIKEWGISTININNILPSKNVIIPIIYYAYKYGLDEDYKEYGELKKYFFLALLRRTFGSHGDSLLKTIRDYIRDNNGKFTVKELSKKLGEDKSLEINPVLLSEETDNKYIHLTLIALNSLNPDPAAYPGRLALYEIDHFYPRSLFENNTTKEAKEELIKTIKNGLEKALKDKKFREIFDKYCEASEEYKEICSGEKEWIDEFIKVFIFEDKMYDALPNRVLLIPRENRKKSKKKPMEWLKEWLEENYDSVFKAINFIPPDMKIEDFTLENFMKFYIKRWKILKDKIERALSIK